MCLVHVLAFKETDLAFKETDSVCVSVCLSFCVFLCMCVSFYVCVCVCICVYLLELLACMVLKACDSFLSLPRGTRAVVVAAYGKRFGKAWGSWLQSARGTCSRTHVYLFARFGRCCKRMKSAA